MAQVDLWVGLGAAVAGSGIGALGAWGGNLVVERRRENLQLLGAMEMLQLELAENADRLAKGAPSAALPLGVWEHCRPTLAGVGRRAIGKQLWGELNQVYRHIYDTRTPVAFRHTQSRWYPRTSNTCCLACVTRRRASAWDSNLRGTGYHPNLTCGSEMAHRVPATRDRL